MKPLSDNCIISCLFGCPHLCKELNILSGFIMYPLYYRVVRICIVADHTDFSKFRFSLPSEDRMVTVPNKHEQSGRSSGLRYAWHLPAALEALNFVPPAAAASTASSPCWLPSRLFRLGLIPDALLPGHPSTQPSTSVLFLMSLPGFFWESGQLLVSLKHRRKDVLEV